MVVYGPSGQVSYPGWKISTPQHTCNGMGKTNASVAFTSANFLGFKLLFQINTAENESMMEGISKN